jgi:hypothetical protein
MELPAAQNCYELHPAFDCFFDEGDDVDCDEVSLAFFEHGGDGEDSEGSHLEVFYERKLYLPSHFFYCPEFLHLLGFREYVGGHVGLRVTDFEVVSLSSVIAVMPVFPLRPPLDFKNHEQFSQRLQLPANTRDFLD